MQHKQERLASLIQDELSKIVPKELEFEGALVTITRVEISSDLKYADINFSAFPSSKNKDALKVLEDNVGHLHHLLLKRVRMKTVPFIRFKIDEGAEKAANIEKIFIDEEKKK